MSTGPSKTAAELNPLSGLLAWKLQTLLYVVCALVLAIIVEYGGMNRLWGEHEGDRLQHRTLQELELLKEHIGKGGAMQTIDQIHRFYQNLLDHLLLSVESWWESTSHAHDENSTTRTIPSRLITNMHRHVVEHSQITLKILREMSFRVAGLTVGWLALFFFVAIGLVDGLVRREVRRWSGGRESSWIYNNSSRLIGPVSMTYTIFLIAWPWVLNIAWAIALFASVNGLLLSIACARFKKYL